MMRSSLTHLKNIFDLTVFGELNIENKYAKIDEISLCSHFLNCYEDWVENRALSVYSLFESNVIKYLNQLDYDEKIEICWLIQENPRIMLFIYESENLHIDKQKSESIASIIDHDINIYLNSETPPISIIKFFTLHFLNIEKSFKKIVRNNSLSLVSYEELIQQYLIRE
ncbi:hypothetical protein M3B46_03085 [Sphingobacterium daejeonense]|uniref:hypothetical protein n=1 Tax=Sphingobacterium daejeonense TaxID=371142 RepID=UPI0021A67877|nr:hypothetical protein [Sphingobacterium daejeonense]MCT1529963.1 hypothetical protein [Sphingobacterium daejeonense]